MIDYLDIIVWKVQSCTNVIHNDVNWFPINYVKEKTSRKITIELFRSSLEDRLADYFDRHPAKKALTV